MSFAVHVFPDVIRDDSDVGSRFLCERIDKENNFLGIGYLEIDSRFDNTFVNSLSGSFVV
jgi:hypothetical protein